MYVRILTRVSVSFVSRSAFVCLCVVCVSITTFLFITMYKFVYACVDMCVHGAHSLSVSMHVLLRDRQCVFNSVYVQLFAVAY
jgi:hypothetical protein